MRLDRWQAVLANSIDGYYLKINIQALDEIKSNEIERRENGLIDTALRSSLKNDRLRWIGLGCDIAGLERKQRCFLYAAAMRRGCCCVPFSSVCCDACGVYVRYV